jgi:hypothetical protein
MHFFRTIVIITIIIIIIIIILSFLLLLDPKLYFHSHVDFIFPNYIKLFYLIRSITFSFSSLDCLCYILCQSDQS